MDKIKTWLRIGKRNPWISEAVDPEFNRDILYESKDFEELWDMVSQGNWSLGLSFYCGNICLINQINAVDEWLVIKENLPFESFTVEAIGREKFLHYMRCIQHATLEQCRKLEYTEALPGVHI